MSLWYIGFNLIVLVVASFINDNIPNATILNVNYTYLLGVAVGTLMTHSYFYEFVVVN